MLQYTEYKTFQQTNINWGETFRMAVKAPAIADRIFSTWSDANDYVHDQYSSAIPGIVLTVINDGDNNAAYYVEKVNSNGVVNLELVRLAKVGEINYKDTTQNRISFIRRIDFINDTPYPERVDITSSNQAIDITPINFDYVYWGDGNVEVPDVEWVYGENEFNSLIELYNRWIRYQEGIGPDYVKINEPNGLIHYYKYVNANLDINLKIDNETITNDVNNENRLKVNPQNIKLVDYEEIEDPSDVILSEIPNGKKFNFKYIEVNYNEYNGVHFTEYQALPVANETSLEFVKVVSDNVTFYRKVDINNGDVIRLKDGTIVTLNDGSVETTKLYFIYGKFYEPVRDFNGTWYFSTKILTDNDKLMKSIEMIEMMTYHMNSGVYFTT